MAHIIKSDSARKVAEADTHVTRPVSFELPDWSERLEAMQRRAEEEAQAIIAKARQEAQAIRERAEREGRAAGQAEAAAIARQVAQQQMESVLPALRQLAEEVGQMRGTWQTEWDGQLLRLAVAIGSRLAGRALAEDPTITRDWIREALELVSAPGRLIVRLHPDDHAALQPHVESLRSALHPAAQLELAADPGIERGGAVIQTEFGEIDQRLSQRAARLLEELTD
ncbi:MAG TPA: hypothetical protein ENJ50_00130 [Planctomycetaceae bacterium]|nr:hypothetical protein [Planctomycetaceae bacterium]